MRKLLKIYDAVIVLGKNWKQYPPTGANPKNFTLELSVESQLSALAAGEMFREGLVKKIILSTGKTAGRNFPSEAAAMKKFMKKYFPRVPAKTIILEERSFDTATNVIEVKKIVKKHGFNNLALLTTKAHMPRADKLFRHFGLKVHDIYSEDEVKKISIRHRKLVKKYENSRKIKVEKIKELLLRQLLVLDPKGKHLRGLTKRIRNQTATDTARSKSRGHPSL